MKKIRGFSGLSLRQKIIIPFLLSIIVTFSYWLSHNSTKEPTGSWGIIIWVLFYIMCFLVALVGIKSSEALEGMVYVITILAEAVVPGFCVDLVSRIDQNSSHYILEIEAHLMLTLMSCALLFGWGIVLIFQYMWLGKTPSWIRVYLLLIVCIGLLTIIWALIQPDKFVGLESAKAARFIPGIWPNMYDGHMSYMRIIITLLTLFIPWIRTINVEANSTTSRQLNIPS